MTAAEMIANYAPNGDVTGWLEHWPRTKTDDKGAVWKIVTYDEFLEANRVRQLKETL